MGGNCAELILGLILKSISLSFMQSLNSFIKVSEIFFDDIRFSRIFEKRWPHDKNLNHKFLPFL